MQAQLIEYGGMETDEDEESGEQSPPPPKEPAQEGIDGGDSSGTGGISYAPPQTREDAEGKGRAGIIRIRNPDHLRSETS